MLARRLALSLFSVGAFALAHACTGSSVPTLDTGLPRSKPANEVTPAEAQQACGVYEDLANESLGPDVQQRIACVVTGIAAQLTGGASCTQTEATCLAQTPTNTVVVDFNCETATTFAPSGCTATIGELEDCVNALAAGLDHFTGSVNCGLVNHLDKLGELVTEATTVANPATYPACASLSTACLDLLGWADASLPPVTGP